MESSRDGKITVAPALPAAPIEDNLLTWTPPEPSYINSLPYRDGPNNNPNDASNQLFGRIVAVTDASSFQTTLSKTEQNKYRGYTITFLKGPPDNPVRIAV